MQIMINIDLSDEEGYIIRKKNVIIRTGDERFVWYDSSVMFNAYKWEYDGNDNEGKVGNLRLLLAEVMMDCVTSSSNVKCITVKFEVKRDSNRSGWGKRVNGSV